MKKIIVILLPLMLCGSLQAQDSVKVRRNSITVSPLPLLGGSALVSYERTLPFRSSVEVELGAQGYYWERLRGAVWNCHTRPGYVGTIGYKFYFPFNDNDKSLLRRGELAHTSCYLKLRLAYVYQWSSYDIYTGNQGWDILTERHTYHEQDLTLALIGGFQYVGRHGFVFSPFAGFNIPLMVDGPFHTIDNPGISAVYAAYLTYGFKIGWAF